MEPKFRTQRKFDFDNFNAFEEDFYDGQFQFNGAAASLNRDWNATDDAYTTGGIGRKKYESKLDEYENLYQQTNAEIQAKKAGNRGEDSKAKFKERMQHYYENSDRFDDIRFNDPDLGKAAYEGAVERRNARNEKAKATRAAKKAAAAAAPAPKAKKTAAPKVSAPKKTTAKKTAAAAK